MAYDRECDQQDIEEIERLGSQISAQFNCPVLSILNHDDDDLILRLHVKGNLSCSYDWFMQAIPAGAKISWHFNQALAIPFTCFILAVPWTLFQVFRHLMLQKLLGWPVCSVASGYNYIESGQIPMGLKKEDLTKT